jgi:hypothetical protein
MIFADAKRDRRIERTAAKFRQLRELEALVTILSSPAGYEVSLFGDMLVIRTTNRTIEVEWKVTGSKGEKSFDYEKRQAGTLRRACRFFMKKRHEFLMGLDHERVCATCESSLTPSEHHTTDRRGNVFCDEACKRNFPKKARA